MWVIKSRSLYWRSCPAAISSSIFFTKRVIAKRTHFFVESSVAHLILPTLMAFVGFMAEFASPREGASLPGNHTQSGQSPVLCRTTVRWSVTDRMHHRGVAVCHRCVVDCTVQVCTSALYDARVRNPLTRYLSEHFPIIKQPWLYFISMIPCTWRMWGWAPLRGSPKKCRLCCILN